MKGVLTGCNVDVVRWLCWERWNSGVRCGGQGLSLVKAERVRARGADTHPSQYASFCLLYRIAITFKTTDIPLEILARSVDHVHLAVIHIKATSARCFSLIPAAGVWAWFYHFAHLPLWSECLCYRTHYSSHSYGPNETTTKGGKPKTRQHHRPASVPLLERFLRPCRLSHHRHSSHVFKANLIIASWLRSHGTLETTTIGRWYMYGSMLDLGHLAFVSLVAGPFQKITYASKLPCW
jgi:hypothetical protein